MKSLLRILTVLLVMNVSTWLAHPKASAQVAVSFQLFYDNLSPYGAWVENPSYGYVWVPSVGVGFSPYATSGHWVYTEYGWTWVSNYAWGWAPFHYGRWYFDPIYGWIWVPDTIWGPAWVAWNSAPGYYGWAPLEPGWDVDVVIVGRVRIPPERWIFVPDRDIDRDDIEHYYGPRTDNERILKDARVLDKTHVDNSTHAKFISGPDPGDVQKRTGRPIQPVKIRQADRPEQKLNKDELVIYRPQVQKAALNGEKPKPTKVVPMKEVKPMRERGAENQAKPAKSPKQMETPKAAPQRQVSPENKQQPQNPNPPRNDNPIPPRNDNPKNNNDKEPVQPSDNNPPGNENQQQNPQGDVKPAPANEAPPPDIDKPNDNTPPQLPRENSQEIKKDQPPPQPEQPKQQPAPKKKKPKE